ncbi:MAG TPA: hypothetical protein VHU13_02805 [Solirubrobacteraceae bacterium]|nr:hypothetical protein [Solirubrobacteraceae bacterium]
MPGVIAEWVPKGRSDCGAHEWYRSDEQTWRCYYCQPAATDSSPWTREEQLQRTLGGISSTLRVVAMGEAASDDRALSELRRLVGEALASLPEEEERLQRLAAAPAAELPDLAQALQAG